MKYRLSFRALIDSDLGTDCPFPPEADDFEMHLQAIVQDISGLAEIVHMSADGANNLIVTAPGVDLQTFKEKLKPLLQQYYKYLRISTIETLCELNGSEP